MSTPYIMNCNKFYIKESCKSTNRHLLDVERRMHFEISRSTAAMSISFILSITPWAFKEAVIACIGGKVKHSDIKNCNCRIEFEQDILSHKFYSTFYKNMTIIFQIS